MTAKPGSDDFKIVCKSLNDSVNDAAAKTVTEPVALGAVDDVEEPAPTPVELLSSELHAAVARSNDSPSAAAVRNRRDMDPSSSAPNGRSRHRGGYSSRNLRSQRRRYLAEARRIPRRSRSRGSG